ncbi:MAG: hypothetical protein ABJB40_12400 [Acidobacteriota bacterium]
MKKKLMTPIGIMTLALLTSLVSAQSAPLEKRIKLVKGQKLVLKGEVYEGDDFYYNFRAKSGQTLTAKLISRDADLRVNTNDGIEVYPISKLTKSWSGRLPYDNTNEYSIMLTSNYKSASYRLEVMLR